MSELLITQILATVLGVLIFIVGIISDMYRDMPNDIKATLRDKPVDGLLLIFETGLLSAFVVFPLFFTIAPWVWPEILIVR